MLACERQLRRAGLPTLIEDYSASEDIFTRALPFLVLVAVLEVSGAANFDWRWWQNLGAIVGGAALLLALFGLFNRWRGRPFTALPRSVGVPELTAFVRVAVAAAAGVRRSAGQRRRHRCSCNLVLVGLVWLVIGVGLFSILRWAGARLFAQLAASLTLMVRALPLILFFGLISFFTAEMWQLFATVPTGRYVAAVILFFAIGLVFLGVRLPDGVRSIEDSVDLAGAPLRKVQRLNLSLVILASQSLQILLVTVLVWLFFTVFGALLVDVSVVEEWTVGKTDELFHFGVLGDAGRGDRRAAALVAGDRRLRRALLHGGDAGRRHLPRRVRGELTDQMRSTFAIRTEYLRLRRADPNRGDQLSV